MPKGVTKKGPLKNDKTKPIWTKLHNIKVIKGLKDISPEAVVSEIIKTRYRGEAHRVKKTARRRFFQ